jgi:hypothetical protein
VLYPTELRARAAPDSSNQNDPDKPTDRPKDRLQRRSSRQPSGSRLTQVTFPLMMPTTLPRILPFAVCTWFAFAAPNQQLFAQEKAAAETVPAAPAQKADGQKTEAPKVEKQRIPFLHPAGAYEDLAEMGFNPMSLLTGGGGAPPKSFFQLLGVDRRARQGAGEPGVPRPDLGPGAFNLPQLRELERSFAQGARRGQAHHVLPRERQCGQFPGGGDVRRDPARGYGHDRSAFARDVRDVHEGRARSARCAGRSDARGGVQGRRRALHAAADVDAPASSLRSDVAFDEQRHRAAHRRRGVA